MGVNIYNSKIINSSLDNTEYKS